MIIDKYEEYCEWCGRIGPPTVFKDFGPREGQFCFCGGRIQMREKDANKDLEKERVKLEEDRG